MYRSFALLICIAALSISSTAKALEVLAYIPAFTTATGFTIPAGVNGPNSVFSSITMTYNTITAVNNATVAQFSGLSQTVDGDPSTNYIQFAFVKNPAYTDWNVTFTGMYVAPAKTNVAQTLELHSYSSVGGFTTSTSNQMNAAGAGLVVTGTTPSATPSLQTWDTTLAGGTSSFRTIASGTNTFSIRIAPDVSGNANLLLGGYSGSFAGTSVSNAMFVLVGEKVNPVPEPGTYVLSALAVAAIAIVGKRRKRSAQAAKPV